MDMKIESPGDREWEEMGILFTKKIPAPSELYQLYNNLLI